MESKEYNLSDIVKEFFDSNTIKIPKEVAKIPPTDLLKKEMLDLVRKKFNIQDYSDFDTQDFIINKIKEHYKKDIMKSKAIWKDLINLCNLETKTERKTIINIAFALELSETECDALLKAGGFSALHYGGDYIETAIYLCLRNGFSYFDCKEIIFDYHSILSNKDVYENKFSIAPTIYSQVTKFFRDKFNKQWEDFFNNHKGGKNESKEQKTEKIKAQMINLSKNSSSFNRSIHKYLQVVLGRGKAVTVKDFCYFYCDNEVIKQTFDSIKNYFYKFKKLKAKPTRDFICLIGVIMYCKYHYDKTSMEDYIRTILDFGYDEHLDENRPVDRFILELSRYNIDSSKIGKSVTTDYITYDDIPVFINRENLPNLHSYPVLMLMKYVISQYVDKCGVHFLYRFVEPQDSHTILEDF